MHANDLVVSCFGLYRYPRDLDKVMLAKQTGLTKSQVIDFDYQKLDILKFLNVRCLIHSTYTIS